VRMAAAQLRRVKSMNLSIRQVEEDTSLVAPLRSPGACRPPSPALAGRSTVPMMGGRSPSQLHVPGRTSPAARNGTGPVRASANDKMRERTSLGSKSSANPSPRPDAESRPRSAGGRHGEAAHLPPLEVPRNSRKPGSWGMGDHLRRTKTTSSLETEADQQTGTPSPKSKSSDSSSSTSSMGGIPAEGPPSTPATLRHARSMTALDRVLHENVTKGSTQSRNSQDRSGQGLKATPKERRDSQESAKGSGGRPRPTSPTSPKLREGVAEPHGSAANDSSRTPAALRPSSALSRAASPPGRSAPQLRRSKLTVPGQLPLEHVHMLAQEYAEDSVEEAASATQSKCQLRRTVSAVLLQTPGNEPAVATADEPPISQRSSRSRAPDEVPPSPTGWRNRCRGVFRSGPMSRRGGPSPRPETLEPQKEIRILRDEKVYDLYCWDEVLQEMGDGGKVVVCKLKNSSEETFSYVMKIRSKESLRKQHHEEEFRKSVIRMLNFPPHEGIITPNEVMEDEKFYYIVMDRAMGGSFFNSLVKEFEDGKVPQHAIKKLMREILEAVDHLHRNRMLHRDIKPDNLVMRLFDDPSNPDTKIRRVVLIDFDHADSDWNPGTWSQDHSCYGTLRFNAPETLRGEYGAASDLYSVGGILYLLMTGKMPHSDSLFEEETDCEDQQEERATKSRQCWMDQVYSLMQEQPIDWECDPWPDLPDCRRFCSSLLAFHARDRFRCTDEALSDSWLAI